MSSLFIHELRFRWKAILGWGLGLIFFGAVYLSVYPEVEEQMVGLADLPLYGAIGIELGSFPAYVGSVILLFIPLLLGIYAITNATKTLAGEEESGTLELLLAKPLSRVGIVLAKAAALAVALLAILTIAGGGCALVLAIVKTGYETALLPGQLFRALASGWPLVTATAMLGLFFAAFVPARRGASLLTAVVFVGSYFLENITGMVPSLDPLKPISLFAYYDSSAGAITGGPETGDVFVLSAVAIVALVLALLAFERRDVTVGAWPWRRNRVPPASGLSEGARRSRDD